MYFRYFCNNLPLEMEMGRVLHLNKLESLSPKDALWQVWLKMAKWFWRRRFLNFVNVFSIFRYLYFFAISQLSPLGKGQGPSFQQTWIPFTQGCFVPSLVENGSGELKNDQIYISHIHKIWGFLKFENKSDAGQNLIHLVKEQLFLKISYGVNSLTLTPHSTCLKGI